MAMNPSEFTNSDDEQRAIEARCLTALAQREHSRAELAADDRPLAFVADVAALRPYLLGVEP